MKVYKLMNALVFRALYGIQAKKLSDVKFINNYFVLTPKHLEQFVANFLPTQPEGIKSRLEEGWSKIAQPDKVLNCLRVEQDRVGADAVMVKEAMPYKESVFLLPFALVYDTKATTLANKSDAELAELGLGKEDKATAHLHRRIKISWATNCLFARKNIVVEQKAPSIKHEYRSFSDFERKALVSLCPVLETCQIYIEGKQYKNPCAACKNLFHKLTDSCDMRFMDCLTHKKCIMGMATASQHLDEIEDRESVSHLISEDAE